MAWLGLRGGRYGSPLPALAACFFLNALLTAQIPSHRMEWSALLRVSPEALGDSSRHVSADPDGHALPTAGLCRAYRGRCLPASFSVGGSFGADDLQPRLQSLHGHPAPARPGLSLLANPSGGMGADGSGWPHPGDSRAGMGRLAGYSRPCIRRCQTAMHRIRPSACRRRPLQPRSCGA